MKNIIDIAVSFDEHYTDIAKVALGSLLQASRGKANYNIHCICPTSLRRKEKEIKKFLETISMGFSLYFHYTNEEFKKGYEVRGISTATYYRLFLHRILPNLDKVIYFDLDVVFQRDLAEIWNYDLGENAFAGVLASFNLQNDWDTHAQKRSYWTELKNCRGKYIQAGFLLMNLKEIRKIGISNETFVAMAEKKYFFVDQDIINILYQNKIAIIPPKYNYCAAISHDKYQRMVDENLYTQNEIEEAKNDFVMCHYAGKKPWRDFKCPRANHWLDYVRSNEYLAFKFLFISKWELFKYKVLSLIKKDQTTYTLAKERYLISKPWRRYYNPSYRLIRKTIIKQTLAGCGYYPHIESPKTLNEKIQWLKLYYRNKVLTQCADKYLMREFVEEKIGSGYLVPILGVWENVNDIDFKSLPDRFVLKMNWGSGQNLICKDKTQLNILEAKKKMREWLRPWKNHYFWGYEWGYKDIKPKIIAEQYIEQNNGDLYDYKIFCTHGTPQFLYIATERSTNVKFDFYDIDFHKLPVSQHYPTSDKIISRPKNWEKILDLASRLSNEFPFVRVDCYVVGDKVYIGELTFYHLNGCEAFSPQEWDLKFGQYIQLPPPNGEYKYMHYLHAILPNWRKS